MSLTEEQLAAWTKPAFGNEEERADKTEAAIRHAIKVHPMLASLDIRVLPKGSFKNNTNVRRDSDIDIAVILQSYIVTDYTGGATREDAGLVPYSGISKADYKAAVGESLRREFGAASVDGSGNKVFRIRGSKTVMDADVIPATQYWYIGKAWQHKGIALILNRPDGRTHFNYPDQHYANGTAKNTRTGRSFKRSVRILKNMENQLVSAGRLEAFPSYLIECLAYNVPDTIYARAATWQDLIPDMCAHIWSYVEKDDEPEGNKRWLEVNGHKYLFGAHQQWSKKNARDFILEAYRMVTK